ncbi:HNH endonuclease signature motif containing protein [Bacillus cihuensis]|uniref:HNH endonuclease signature motif containing protein n=1 Tax=Bacillus cihuensis TaxID=1208599 RepID=UPI000424DB33|nr:HNH endonuclease signature motif containing protein [Bacillus cihuensis]
MRAPAHNYTDEQKIFVRENIKGRSRKELTELFNDNFNTNLKVTQMVGFIKRNGLVSGLDGRFIKGQEAWNKGVRGVDFCGENGKKTQFKKGNKPHNYKPVGTERVNGDDYVDIKIADPNKWRAKHLIVWESVNGEIPKKHVVIFGDGNRRNFEPDNLILVSRAQLAMLNKHNLIQDNADLTKTGILVADIYKKIGERKKK